MIIEREGYQVKLLRKPVKNLNLRIHASGAIILSAPMRCPLDYIYAYLQDKHDWIIFHHKRLQSRVVPQVLQYKTGEHHYFLGQAYKLIVYEQSCKNELALDEISLHMYTLDHLTLEERKAVITAWYRMEFKKLLPDLIKKWEPIIGVQVKEWGIKAMKTRWGSCNTREKRVWLNLHLIQKPLICIEYVLVHEMVHLLEPSHNKRFYAFMSKFMPDWQSSKKLLESKKN